MARKNKAARKRPCEAERNRRKSSLRRGAPAELDLEPNQEKQRHHDQAPFGDGGDGLLADARLTGAIPSVFYRAGGGATVTIIEIAVVALFVTPYDAIAVAHTRETIGHVDGWLTIAIRQTAG